MRYNSFDGTYMWKKKGEYKCRICRDNVKEYRRMRHIGMRLRDQTFKVFH